jgi:transcriptional regulator with XRE-family HTH domain
VADRGADVIGARIAKRRHQLGWSQIELARRLGVSPSSVANWERGASYPLKTLGRVEQVLGIPLDGPDIAPEPPPPPLISPEVERAVRADAESPEEAEELLAAMRERKLSRLSGARRHGEQSA